VVAVSNASGAVIENISYSPLGEVITGGNTTRYEYEGKESDLVIGDTDFNARRYKPDFGIFEQPDSLIQNVHDPQNLNRYMFERGNSYNRVDPTGHIIWVLFGIIVGIGLLTGVLYMKSHPYTPENKLNYAAKAVAHAETAGIVAGLTSGYSASGPLVTYSAPSLLEIGLYGAGQSVIDQSIEGQSIDPGLVAQDTATSMLLSEIFSPAITRQGQIMPTQSVGNIYAMDTYYSTYASYLFNNMISSMSSDANAASSGGRSGGGNTGHWGENQYAYTDPNDYPEDPNGVCQAPPPPKPNPFRLT
ncbi:hypothetical protein JW756_05010, partial [Candidatus Woesearchaeota archaeon]|nr:hypothetical protein [Candidatus Woesearchaeota archaeon]